MHINCRNFLAAAFVAVVISGHERPGFFIVKFVVLEHCRDWEEGSVTQVVWLLGRRLIVVELMVWWWLWSQKIIKMSSIRAFQSLQSKREIAERKGSLSTKLSLNQGANAHFHPEGGDIWISDNLPQMAFFAFSMHEIP